MSWKELTKNTATTVAAEKSLATEEVSKLRREQQENTDWIYQRMQEGQGALTAAINAHKAEFEQLRRLVGKVQDSQDTMAAVYGERLTELQNSLGDRGDQSSANVVTNVQLIGRRIEESEKRVSAAFDTALRKLDSYIVSYMPGKMTALADRAVVAGAAHLDKKYSKLKWLVMASWTPWLAVGGWAAYLIWGT